MLLKAKDQMCQYYEELYFYIDTFHHFQSQTSDTKCYILCPFRLNHSYSFLNLNAPLILRIKSSRELTWSEQLILQPWSQYRPVQLMSMLPSEPSQHSSLTIETQFSVVTCPSDSPSTSVPTRWQNCFTQIFNILQNISILFKNKNISFISKSNQSNYLI